VEESLHRAALLTEMEARDMSAMSQVTFDRPELSPCMAVAGGVILKRELAQVLRIFDKKLLKALAAKE